MATDLFRDDIPRGGLSRAVAAVTAALGVLQVNGIDSPAGLAIATDPTKVATTIDTTYRIGGVQYTLLKQDDFWALSGNPVPPSSWQKYALLVDAAGSPSVISGNGSGVSAQSVKVVQLGATAEQAVIGLMTVATDGATTFTPGVDPLNATGVTVTFADGVDVAAMFPTVASVAL